MHRVAVIRGDGIGPEICDAALQVVEAAGVEVEWEEVLMGRRARRRLKRELPWESLKRVRELGAALKGPLEADTCGGGILVDDGDGLRRHPSINNGLRRELGTFVNLRPMRGYPGVSGRYQDLDVILVREVTEDLYMGLERRLDEDSAEAVKRITRGASRRAARFACEYSLRRRRKKITAVHKANVLHQTDGLFLESVRSVVARYPSLHFDDRLADAACYLLVTHPELFDVLLLPNQYGDILSGLVAGLLGSVGLAPGANFGPEVSLFEAAHGAAPDIAGRGIANPVGMVLSSAMLLEHLQEGNAACRIRRAVAATLSEGRVLPPDLGGRANTAELIGALCENLERG